MVNQGGPWHRLESGRHLSGCSRRQRRHPPPMPALQTRDPVRDAPSDTGHGGCDGWLRDGSRTGFEHRRHGNVRGSTPQPSARGGQPGGLPARLRTPKVPARAWGSGPRPPASLGQHSRYGCRACLLSSAYPRGYWDHAPGCPPSCLRSTTAVHRFGTAGTSDHPRAEAPASKVSSSDSRSVKPIPNGAWGSTTLADQSPFCSSMAEQAVDNRPTDVRSVAEGPARGRNSAAE
jgi:hypothetical protein